MTISRIKILVEIHEYQFSTAINLIFAIFDHITQVVSISLLLFTIPFTFVNHKLNLKIVWSIIYLASISVRVI